MSTDINLYDLPYTGEEVEAILKRTFLNNSGFIKLESSLANPINLDTVVDYALSGISVSDVNVFDYPLGNFLIEYYLNGPYGNVATGNTGTNIEMEHCAPLSLFCTLYTNPDINAQGSKVLHQTAFMSGTIWTRYKPLLTNATFTQWTTTSVYTGSTTGLGDELELFMPSITNLTDMSIFFVKINADLLSGATLSINGGSPIPIYTGDGNPINSGVVKSGSIVGLTYNKTANRLYLIGGGGYGKIFVQETAPTDAPDDTLWCYWPETMSFNNIILDPIGNLFSMWDMPWNTTYTSQGYYDQFRNLKLFNNDSWQKISTGVSVIKNESIGMTENSTKIVTTREIEDFTLIEQGTLVIPMEDIPENRILGYSGFSKELYSRENCKCTLHIDELQFRSLVIGH